MVATLLLPTIQLILALLLGTLIGIERTFAGKTAGMRTFSLVSMGSCLFIVVSKLVTEQYIGMTNFDPLRLAAGIVMGIGFLGGGLIVFRENRLSGLTTAAALWVACGIGIAVGFELFGIAISATILTLFSFTVMWTIESRIKKEARKRE